MQGIGLLAAFLTGLAGSLHCAAGCSAISFALTFPARPDGKVAGQFAAVQGGRLTAYALAGGLVGGGGGTLMALIGLAGAHQWLQISAAAMMAWTGLAVAGLAPSPHRLGALIPIPVLPLASVRRFGTTRQLGFLCGFSWGLMPCGMVYLALMTATFAGSAGSGATYMAAFFLGTLPALTGTTFGLARGAGSARNWTALRRPAGLAIIALAAGTLAIPNDMMRMLCHQ